MALLTSSEAVEFPVGASTCRATPIGELPEQWAIATRERIILRSSHGKCPHAKKPSEI